MTRAERRRNQRTKEKAHTATYNLTEQQLDILIRERIRDALDKAHEEGYEAGKDDGLGYALELLLLLPLGVLKDHYWKKTYDKKLPEFTQHVLDYYSKYLNDELDIEELRETLWECAGIRIEKREGREEDYEQDT